MTEQNQKQVIALTTCMILAFIIFGCLANSLGPSLLRWSLLLDVTLTQMSLSYTFNGIGYLLGSFLCGLLFDRLNAELQFLFSCFLIGLVAIILSQVQQIYFFYALMLFLGSTMAFFEASAKPYCVKIWDGHKYKSSIVQLSYTTQGLGYFLGPLIVRPFLVNIHSDNCTAIMYQNATTTVRVNATCDLEHTAINLVRYPYFLNGIAMCVVGILFLFPFALLERYKRHCLRVKTKVDSDLCDKAPEEDKLVDSTKSLKVMFVLLIAMFSFCMVCVLLIPFSLLPSFVEKHLHWSPRTSALIASTFSGSQTIGRLLAAFISLFIKPTAMLLINLCTTAVGYVLILIVGILQYDHMMWVATAISGIGSGSIFASYLIWLSEQMKMTGSLGSLVFVSGSVGAIVGPSLTGFLFDYYNLMWVPYLMLLSIAMETVIFITLLCLLALYRKKTSAKNLEKELQTLNVDS